MRLGSILLAASLIAGICLAREPIHCPGEYNGHLQGIARDAEGNIYWSFTTVLVKTDAQGVSLAQIDVPTHYGDLTTHDGRVYVAVNHGKFNQEPGVADSWVYVHDAATLKLITRHAVPEVVHGAGGMAWHGGRFMIIGGLPSTHQVNYVYEYTKDFKFVQRHVIESGQTLLGIQTVCRGRDNTWWFGCYGKPAVTLRCDDNFKLLGTHKFNSAVGIVATDDEKVLLVGRNKRDPKTKKNIGWAVWVPSSEILAK